MNELTYIPIIVEEKKSENSTQNFSEQFDQKYFSLKDKFEDSVERLLNIFPKKSSNIPVLKRFQSLSIDVPGICPNKCSYCVSAMHEEDLGETARSKKDFEKFRPKYIDAMSWIKDEGTDTVMLTGGLSDPIVNNGFLEFIAGVNNELGDKKFRKVEIQTSGILIDDAKLDLLEKVGIKTISLSLSSFNSRDNNKISGIKENLHFDIKKLTQKIKQRGFNLRLSFNLNSSYHKEFENGIDSFFEKCEEYGANQIVFRELYSSGEGQIDDWIQAHKFDEQLLRKIKRYIKKQGRILGRLPFGQLLYSINGKISTLIDDDCMNSKGSTDVQKYSIIRPNGKLYSHWDDEGSLIF